MRRYVVVVKRWHGSATSIDELFTTAYVTRTRTIRGAERVIRHFQRLTPHTVPSWELTFHIERER